MNATIAQLRHFIALAESGSFTRGADSTRRSQAAFSRSIAVLEENLGVALVERVGHRNALTLIGRTVLEHARQVVAQADELHQVVRHHVSGHAGQIRIGLGATPGALLTQPLLQFASTYPAGMKIRTTRGPLEQQLLALRNRQVDAVVIDLRSVPHAHSDLLVEKVGELPTGVLCRSGHPLTQQDPLAFADLQRFPVACTGMSDVLARQLVQRYGPAAHPEVLITLESEDVKDLLQTVCDSDTVYLGILAPAHPLRLQQRLVALPIDATGLESHIAWVQRAGRAPNPVLDEIHALVRTELAQQARL